MADAAALYAYLRDPVVTELTSYPVASVPLVEAMIERSLSRSLRTTTPYLTTEDPPQARFPARDAGEEKFYECLAGGGQRRCCSQPTPFVTKPRLAH
jgi:hypothetical protein